MPGLPSRPQEVHMPLAVTSPGSTSLAPVKAAVYLVARREVILAAAKDELSARSPKYAAAADPVLEDRLSALYAKLIESLTARTFVPLLDHARDVAEERFHAGYDLSEVQKAYNSVEEAIWSCVFADGSRERYAVVLPCVCAAMGAAMDELARAYVALAAAAHAPAVDVAALFRGGEPL
jgi:hypothetical protein